MFSAQNKKGSEFQGEGTGKRKDSETLEKM